MPCIVGSFVTSMYQLNIHTPTPKVSGLSAPGDLYGYISVSKITGDQAKEKKVMEMGSSRFFID
jgi:hypothetical protein